MGNCAAFILHKIMELESKPKGPIKFDITLSEEQKDAKSKMMNSTCTVLNGSPGTSKTTLCMNVALTLLFKKEIQKIYLTRPPIELAQFSKNGALPGDAKEKNAIYMAPFLDAIKSNYSKGDDKKARMNKAFEKNQIEFIAMPFIRGSNLGDSVEKCVVIVDEGQSCDMDTMYAILTRLGEGSKMFITMDLKQADHKGKSGGEKLLEIVDKVEGLEKVELTENYRSKFVQDINNCWWDK